MGTAATQGGAGVATGLGVEEVARGVPELTEPVVRGFPLTTSDILFSKGTSELVMLFAAPGKGGKELASMVKLSAAAGG